MYSKWIGAILVIAACGGYGFSLAAAYNREASCLRQLNRIIGFMECQLQYRLTPLPELCRQAAGEGSGKLRDLMLCLAVELEKQALPDVHSCMRSALRCVPDLPRSVRRILVQMGRSLGRFDLPGQIKGLQALEDSCSALRRELESSKHIRVRNYQTLSLCAGIALAILFI